ncbi:MAG: GntR family transcriptional regulator, partial [Phycisphaerae bacterium]|nr:GntR family transcriptional regulator [Phycisphaerae bacterium]
MDIPAGRNIDHKSTTPLHRQLYLILKEQILGNKLPPETPIPSERKLAERFSVSRNTVKQAILALASEGLVYRATGKGSFVAG